MTKPDKDLNPIDSQESNEESIPAKRRGRPPNSKRKLPPINAPITAQKMYDFGKIGMNLKSMADAAGVSYEAFYGWWNHNPKLRAYYLKGKGDGKEERLILLNKKILEGNNGCLYFALERIDGFAQKSNLDIQMPERPALDISDERKFRIAESIMERFKGQSFEAVKGSLGAAQSALTAETIDIEPLAEVKNGIAAAESSLRGYPASKIIDGGGLTKVDKEAQNDGDEI